MGEMNISSTVAASSSSFHDQVMSSVRWLLSKINIKTTITKTMNFVFLSQQYSYRHP